MTRILCLSIILMLSSIVSAQSWTVESAKSLKVAGFQDFHPTKFLVAKTSDREIKEILWSAPYEDQTVALDSPAQLNLMLANGEKLSFGIVRYDMQEPLLAAKFDNIRTFKGVCLSDRRIRVRLDYTVHGLRAVINGPKTYVYIEHYKRGNRDYKIIYNRSDYESKDSFTCSVTGERFDSIEDEAFANVRQGNCELNLLQLANAANIEYCDYHISNAGAGVTDEEAVHSAVVTTINRVNEVYEQEFGVRMILVNNNEILYYLSGTDPYSNGDGGSMLGQNQTTIDNAIGSANYDIGHVFSTGGGGVAYLSSVCNNNRKAGGVTGQNTPIGDPFDIDYVAHEMGHQMGANHTQNNNCNRNSSTAMEPGSASTIMGYAGICSPNVQSNSDPYFHAISVEEVMNDASVFSCAEEIVNFGNTTPAVTVLASSYTIPKSTSFVLDANGSDPDGDDITYCWEQMDNETATMPPVSTNTSGPTFRSLQPVVDSKRYFPSLPDIIAGNNPEWEVLPSVSRDMNFRVTVRDWHDGPGSSDAGCTAEADVAVDVDGNSGPFIVTSQSVNVTWELGEIETITWEVANTSVAPVSCTNVEIWFSEDDNFDTPTLLTTTTNDGSASITVPSIITTTGKIMVKGANNIFFDINEGEIAIEQTAQSYEMSISEASDNYCGNVNTTSTNIGVSSVAGYNLPVQLSVSGLPAGSTATFSSNPVAQNNVTTLTISGFSGQTGIYNMQVQGQSGSIIKTVTYQLALFDQAIASLAVEPLNGGQVVELQPTLIWEDLVSDSYEYQFADGPNAMSVIQTGTVNENQVDITSMLEPSKTYYWRVKTVNSCGTSAWSDLYTFNTLACPIYASTDLPMSISPSGSNTITSDLTFSDKGTVSDVNIVNLVGTHSYMSDLNFSLTAPDNTSIELWDQPCGSNDDFNINFDDEAASNNFPCPPTDGNTYQPDNSLSVFQTKELFGIWQMQITDDSNQDGGELTAWGLEVCMSKYCDLTVSTTDIDGLGSFRSALRCAESGDTIRLMTDIADQVINLSEVVTLDKNINIVADDNDNITLNFNAAGGLIITDVADVSLEGFTIKSMAATPTISNSGALKLTNVDIEHPTENQILMNASGSLQINGICNIKE